MYALIYILLTLILHVLQLETFLYRLDIFLLKAHCECVKHNYNKSNCFAKSLKVIYFMKYLAFGIIIIWMGMICLVLNRAGLG